MPIPSPIRRRLVALRDGLDGRLHPRRRVSAGERLAALDVESVLFVCLGNVCRSPYGERVFAARAGDGLRVASAGFIGPGRPPPDSARRVAGERGVRHDDHRSQLVTPEMLAGADAIFFFDRYNLARLRRAAGVRPERLFWLGDFDSEWAGRRAIPDPWGKPEEEFQRVFARIERCVAEVWEVLGGGLTP
ncbi:MAG: hypothetical protein RQ751_02645 [Longimicrobiales bacterium]|nr:hypothetical protein [Longimicrobiales bacterium]